MRQKLKYNILIIGCLTIISACYEPIDVKYTGNSDTLIVIEGLLRDNNPACTVLISKTTSVQDTTGFVPETNALVIISDDEGGAEKLLPISPGKYISQNFRAISGKTYNLNVSIGKNHYCSSETMQPCSIKDSVYIEDLKDDVLYDDGKYVKAIIKTTINEVQYFRLRYYKNDSLYNNYSDIALFKTEYLPDSASFLIPYKVESGDTIVLELYSLTKDIYNYFSAYSKITNSPIANSTIPPLNPPVNIDGGALGYFQVSSVLTDSVIIP